MLSFKDVSLILAALTNVILGLYVLAKGSKSQVNRSLAAYTFSLSLWSISSFLFEVFSNRELIMLAGRMAFFWGGFSAAACLAFSIIFCEKDGSSSRPIKIFLVYLVGFLFSGFGLTPFVMKDIAPRPWGNETFLAPGYKIFAFYISVFMGFVIVKLVQKYNKAKKGLEQLQLKYLFFGFGVPLSIGAFFSVYLPFITDSGRYFFVGNLASIFTASIISYAIIKHRLLEIEIVISKTVYLTAAILGIFVLLLTLDYFFYIILKLPKTFSIFFSAIILTILVGTFNRNLDTWVKRIFMKDVFTYQIALRDFSRQLTTILDLSHLQNMIVEKIAQIMKIDKVSLLLLNEIGAEYRIVTAYPLDKNHLQTRSIEVNSPVCEQLRENQRILIVDELPKFSGTKEFNTLAQDFHRLSSKLFIPLIIRGKLIGIIGLGSKLKGRIFSDEDVNLLQRIGDEAALALENAKLYNEVLVTRDNYEMILQQMDSGVIAVNMEGVVVTFNARAGDILRIEPQTILGQKIDRLGNKLASIFKETLRGGKYFNKIFPLNLPAMNEKRILNMSSLIKDRGAKILGGLLVFSDVTELRQLEEEVRRGEKLATLGNMAARVAHEIRNPLVSIKTFCQVLPNKYQDQGFREGFLPLVIKEVDRISNITEDLLNLSQFSPKIFKLVSVRQILEESLILIKEELSVKEILVNRSYTQEDLKLLADPDRLKQVFLNLFINSIYAMDKGGTLTISTEREYSTQTQDSHTTSYNSDSVAPSSHQANSIMGCIRISDTGNGIPEEYLSNIFEPFFTTKEKGTGLGLVISKEIIKDLKGSIEVENQPGVGCTFIIKLPLSAQNFGEADGQISCITHYQ